MNLNKNISVWRGSDTPPTEYHLWIKDGLLYIYSDGQWKELVFTACQNQIKDLYECKQDTLVSGVNIKTINDESLLGEGNIVIEAPDMTDYSKVNGDNKFTGNNSFSKALTVDYTKIASDGITLPSGTKYSHDEIKLQNGTVIYGYGLYQLNSKMKLSGQEGCFSFMFDDLSASQIYRDHVRTKAIKGFNDYTSDYLILDRKKSVLSLNYTQYTPTEIKYLNKTIPLADIVVVSDLEETKNVVATTNQRLTKLEEDINTILESINNGNS